LKSRKFLFDTLHDRDNVGSVISKILGVIFWSVMTAVTLVIFGFNVYSVFVPFGTFIVALSFVFGNSLKTIWESTIFILVIRPYDVGDRVQFGTETVETVSRINLLTTESYGPDGRLYIHQHSQLYLVTLIQHQRSKDYVFSFSIDVAKETTEAQLKGMQKKLTEFLSTDTSVPWKFDTWSWGVSSIDNKDNKMNIWFWIELNEVNWSKPIIFTPAKTSLLLQLKKICGELQIGWQPPK